MNLLALDTSTERLCVALCVGQQVFTHEEAGGAQASQRLLPAAEALMRRTGLKWGDLQGLGFGQGPGAFTGLRGTCAAVQGLALGLGLAAVAVPSLRIVAVDAWQQSVRQGVLAAHQACTVQVALDARMGQVYDDAAYWDGRQWHQARAPAVRSPVEVLDEWRASHAVEGRAGREGSAAITLYAGSGLHLMPTDEAEPLRASWAAWVPDEQNRSAALAACLLAAWALGPHLDAAQVMPMYVRDRVAQTTAEREAERQARFHDSVLAQSPAGPVTC